MPCQPWRNGRSLLNPPAQVPWARRLEDGVPFPFFLKGPTSKREGVIPLPYPAVDNPPFASVRIGEEGLGRETESGEHLCNKKHENNP